LNGGPIERFDTRLDASGEAHFEVLAETRKGTYRFLSLKALNAPEWQAIDEQVVVR